MLLAPLRFQVFQVTPPELLLLAEGNLKAAAVSSCGLENAHEVDHAGICVFFVRLCAG